MNNRVRCLTASDRQTYRFCFWMTAALVPINMFLVVAACSSIKPQPGYLIPEGVMWAQMAIALDFAAGIAYLIDAGGETHTIGFLILFLSTMLLPEILGTPWALPIAVAACMLSIMALARLAKNIRLHLEAVANLRARSNAATPGN